MISEGSCDTEDWKFSFASTEINYIFKYINIEVILKETLKKKKIIIILNVTNFERQCE